ncbi:hypothetical protein CYMTET_30865 [Cymbomonas tetramitiformis]|uniref:Uncharacterized protein n=1 Tax=Cymbomonas tetramitiformis TaxID=36881 RepID=A0AAE0KTI4_9CHLO|nr:hypothetical protein CYMTET_30865 [Cymbomonas tetramitiformis]
MNRIHPAFQSYTQFDLWGHLMRCSALPLRWNDSPRILVKVMWALAEAIRAPQALRDRTELRKRRGGAGGTGSCKAQALRVRETLTNTLHRLGMERNEKKGVWEPTPLVEHLGLEVGTKDGQFKEQWGERTVDRFAFTSPRSCPGGLEAEGRGVPQRQWWHHIGQGSPGTGFSPPRSSSCLDGEICSLPAGWVGRFLGVGGGHVSHPGPPVTYFLQGCRTRALSVARYKMSDGAPQEWDSAPAAAGSMQPYLSAINNYRKDLGFEGPAKGRVVGVALGHSWLLACVESLHLHGGGVLHLRPARDVNSSRMWHVSQEHTTFMLRKGKGGQRVWTKWWLVIPLQHVDTNPLQHSEGCSDVCTGSRSGH